MAEKDKKGAGFRAKSFVQTALREIEQLDRWQQIGPEEVQIAAELTERNELSGGTPVVREFEERWREWIGSRYSVSVINGNAAVYSAYFGVGVGPGDEVICPANTWICSIAPAVFLGARPVFCDVDPDTLQLDPADVEARITDKTACICAVHLWGNVCNMDALMDISERRGVSVVEDCSHSHGARWKGAMCGSIGAAGAWSLQGSKAVSAGEGGMLTTDDTDLFERACLLGQVNRAAGVDQATERYAELQPFGFGMKLRAHPLGMGIALKQLDKLAGLNQRRRTYIEAVEAGLDSIEGLKPVRQYDGAERAGFYGFPVIHEPEEMGVATEAYVDALRRSGPHVHVRPYPNLHELPLFAKGFDIYGRGRGPLAPEAGYRGYAPGDLPQAQLAAARTIFLPRLSDPAPEAADVVLEWLQVAARDAREASAPARR